MSPQYPAQLRRILPDKAPKEHVAAVSERAARDELAELSVTLKVSLVDVTGTLAGSPARGSSAHSGAVTSGDPKS